MVFDDNAYLDIHEIKLETALDADPRMPLGCIILHQKNIVAGSDHISGLIFVWSFDTSNKIKFKLIKTLQGHRSNVIALQDLSTCFASCSKDGTLRLWKDFECIYIIPKCHGLDKYPTSLACYHVPGQKTPNLYSGGTDGLIISYDITKGRASNVAAGHSGWILCLACKADTPFLFSGSSDFTVRLWDAVTLQFLYSFEGHSESVYSIGLFENYLVSGDRCGEIRLYDIFTSECLGIFRDYYMINSLQIYKRDGRMRLLSMGQGNFLCEWDTATQEYNCINKYHFGTIRSSMIYENWLFTAARDGAVGVWQLEKGILFESKIQLMYQNHL
jgi:WD40 repeat protein